MPIHAPSYESESSEQDSSMAILAGLHLDTQTYHDIFGGTAFIADEGLQPRFKTDAPEGVVLKMSTGKRDEGAISIVYCFNPACHEIFIDGWYLPPRLQGHGILTKSIAALILRAKDNGYKVITASCKRFDTDPIEIGYFVRPMLGRNGLHQSVKLYEHITHYCAENNIDYSFPAHGDILDLCATQQGIEIWKAIGWTFPGEFNLAIGSKSIAVFKSFIDKKK